MTGEIGCGDDAAEAAFEMIWCTVNRHNDVGGSGSGRLRATAALRPVES